MGREQIFRFKQFAVTQSRAAMKVNTDGVLLGAWVDVSGASKVLDVGTGTGTIALMVAQKNLTCSVVGIDIDEGAAADSMINARNSPWSERVTMYHQTLQRYKGEQKDTYDHIISNPPFFNAGSQAQDEPRSVARHTDTLSHRELIADSSSLLTPAGQLSVIVPKDVEVGLLEVAREHDLYTSRSCQVWINEKKVGRVMITFSRTKSSEVESTSILIRRADGSYSDDYKELTKDFYLHF